MVTHSFKFLEVLEMRTISLNIALCCCLFRFGHNQFYSLNNDCIFQVVSITLVDRLKIQNLQVLKC